MQAIQVTRLSDTAIIPTQGSPGADGWDLYADELRRMMHESWARNAERAKNAIDLSDRARFMQNGKKFIIAYYADRRW